MTAASCLYIYNSTLAYNIKINYIIRRFMKINIIYLNIITRRSSCCTGSACTSIIATG